MAMAPYVLVLASNAHEGAKYARRAKLTRGRYRVVSSASSIKGLRRAEVHILPGFRQRIDRHSILGALRWAQCQVKEVEMPARAEGPAKDQGDGMGEQMTIDEALAARREAFSQAMVDNALAALKSSPGPVEVLSASSIHEKLSAKLGRMQVVAQRYDRLRDAALEEPKVIPEVVALVVADDEPEAPIVKPNRRRTRCGDCETLHFKGEPCPVVETKAPAVIGFD